MGRRSRRKLGCRNYRNYTQEVLEVAVDLVKKKIITSSEAEKRFFIPRRTIENKVKGLHMNPPGSQQRLNQDEEKDIVDVLIAAAEFGSPLSRLELRIVIFEYLNSNRRACLFDNKLPGKWWVKNFLERHHKELTERSVQNIKRARAEKTIEEMDNYFNNLERTLKDVQASNILNYDETNLSDNPGSTKCIFKRKVKYPERIINHSKGNISIMFAASAEGSLLPVYVVYKSEHLWSTWCSYGPPDARFNRTKSGWFDARVFEDWFESTVIPWATKLQGPKVVIGDNLSSHLNPNIIKLCEQHEIRFAFLPPNSTHMTQPLDVAYFGPLKKCWRSILTEYKIKNPSETQINKGHFPILLKQLVDKIEMSNKDNIKAGFKATGIFPFNPHKIKSKLPDNEEENKYKIDQALLDFLKKARAPNPLKKTAINKKLKVEPGTSISSRDLEALMANNGKKTQKNETSNKKSTDQTRVTILSDVRVSPENQSYIDVRQCSSLNLKKVSANFDLSTANKNKEIDPENPVPSTSGTRPTIKRKATDKRKLQKTKKLKIEHDSDDENYDNYSLRDTSEEEMSMSDDMEDMYKAILEKKYRKMKNDKTVKTENRAPENQDIENFIGLDDLTMHVDIVTPNKDSLDCDTKKLYGWDDKENIMKDTYEIKTNQREVTEEFEEIEYLISDMDLITTTNHLDKLLDKDEKRVVINENQKVKVIENICDTDKTGIHQEEIGRKEVKSMSLDIDKINEKEETTRRIETAKGSEETEYLKWDMNDKVNDKENFEGCRQIDLKFDMDEMDILYKKTEESKKTGILKSDITVEKTLGHEEIMIINSDKEDNKKNQKAEELLMETNSSMDKGRSVLVRYYIRKKWKFYIGLIDKTEIQEQETYYSITFLKTIKNPSLKFVISKNDRDTVPPSSIVKFVKLYSGKRDNEYIIGDCDKHYFQ